MEAVTWGARICLGGLKNSETRNGSAQSAVAPGSERQLLKPPGPEPAGCQAASPCWNGARAPLSPPGAQSRAPSPRSSPSPEQDLGISCPRLLPGAWYPRGGWGQAPGGGRAPSLGGIAQGPARPPHARWHRWQPPRCRHAAVTPGSPQEARGRRTPTASQSTAGAAAGGGGGAAAALSNEAAKK